MRYVLDASVALKWALSEPDSPQALALRDDFRQNLHELLAPDTFPVEVARALARAERKGILTPPQATILLADVLSTPPSLYPSITLLPRAVELSSQARVGVYDCLYVALAERESCRVVTADNRLIQSLPGFPLVALAAL